MRKHRIVIRNHHLLSCYRLAVFGFVGMVPALALGQSFQTVENQPSTPTSARSAPLATASRAVHHAPTRSSFARQISQIGHHAFIAPSNWVQSGYSALSGQSHRLSRGCAVRACHTHYFGRPVPLGSVLQTNLDRQIDQGKKARLVMYAYDFENDPSRDQAALSPAGRRKLERLVAVMESTGHPLIIEPSREYPSITESRRMHVVNVLESDLYFSNAHAQVVVRSAPGSGLRGVEAVEIERNQVNTTRSQGTTFAAGRSSGFSPSSSGSGSGSGNSLGLGN